ncbi:hypothetical protein WMY93_019154 [Mugilogobius chulae]|uniref:RNase NYN domain-containing protein n=1 Tax=Mugilogobius chulae TaxID=88201 RepID=A0AAW0NQE0_9GOBI
MTQERAGADKTQRTENPNWKRFIDERLIMFSFVNNKFMPPDDPMGRHGPSLDDLRRKYPIVQKKQNCPYGERLRLTTFTVYGVREEVHVWDKVPIFPPGAFQTVQSDSGRRTAQSIPSTSQLSTAPTPAPGHSLSLVEDMAKKLTLSSPLKKDHHSETSHSHGKGSHSKKTAADSHDLDSGLGSIDPHHDANYGTNMYSQPTAPPVTAATPLLLTTTSIIP